MKKKEYIEVSIGPTNMTFSVVNLGEVLKQITDFANQISSAINVRIAKNKLSKNRTAKFIFERPLSGEEYSKASEMIKELI